MDMTGESCDLHMRTDAYNLVTTASTTHLPEQKETIHMINQLRHEALTGSIDDLAHVSSADCLSDCLTKSSAKPDALIKAVNEGQLPNTDKHPPFREMMKPHHKAYLLQWLVTNIPDVKDVVTFLNMEVQEDIVCFLRNR